MDRRSRENVKQFYKRAMFNLSANNGWIYAAFYKFFYKPAPGSLSEFINYYSKRNPGLKVVQVGANDGFIKDPIHKFIRRDQWQGVLLEPQPDVYENYLKRLHKKTAGIYAVNAALDYKDGVRTMYKLAVSDARWAHGLSSFNRHVLEAAVDSGKIDHSLRAEGKPIPAKKEDYIREVPVTCISSQTLLKKYNIDKLDFLQIDAEGFDYEIIKMFNIPLTKPKVVVFESHNLSKEEKQACANLLKAEGYAVKEYGGDTLAMHQPGAEYQRFF